MIKNLLKAAGILSWPSVCHDPPAETYGIYFDDVAVDGPDGVNAIYTHNATVELYEPTEDDAAETAFEAELNAHGLHYEKQTRYWLHNVRRYQTIYEFTYTEKRRT